MNNKEIKRYFSKVLSNQLIEEIAINSGFKIRNTGKIKPITFLNLCCFNTAGIANSTLEEMASHLNFKHDIEISPQGIDLRFNNASVKFLKQLFQYLCKNQFNENVNLFKNFGFREIFLMDSTEIKLPKCHIDKYRGCNPSNPSVMKLNYLMELLSYRTDNVVIAEGRCNEHNFSKHIYDKLTVNSLVLKDLGYYKYHDFIEIENRGAHFISRLRAGARLYKLNPNPRLKKDGKPFSKDKYIVTQASELADLLNVGETKEYTFLLGEQKRSYRIIIKKLDAKSQDRKLELINKRERRSGVDAINSKKSSEISAYITNYDGLDPEGVVELYRLRRQIELLFKLFKSDFDIDKLKNMKIERIEAYIYSKLIRVLIIMELTKRLMINVGKTLSIIRIIKATKSMLDNFLCILNSPNKFIRLVEKVKSEIVKKIKRLPM